MDKGRKGGPVSFVFLQSNVFQTWLPKVRECDKCRCLSCIPRKPGVLGLGCNLSAERFLKVPHVILLCWSVTDLENEDAGGRSFVFIDLPVCVCVWTLGALA